MVDVDVNVWGVLAATVAAMVIGSVWYSSSVFGREWAKLAKISRQKAKKDAPVAMLGMAFFAFIAAYVLAHLTFIVDYFYDGLTYTNAALITALLVWLGFILYSTLPAGIFEQKPARLSLINAGNNLISILVMAVVIGWIGL
jgi:hypothetical protein